jgi:hypothetical protein
MEVEIIIPFAGSNLDRVRALKWVTQRCQFPHTMAFGEIPFNKALTVMPAVERSEAEIVVIHDADVWTTGLEAAVKAVADGASWAIPHWKVLRLTKASTHSITIGGEPSDELLDRPAYVGVAGGGIVVSRRDTLLEIPLDPRFTTWGQEDESWAMALWCLLGEPWRGESPLIHLWHPLEPRQTRRKGSQGGWDLRNRYARERHNLAGMTHLLREARDALLLSR